MASKLTEKKAIEISKELWDWLAETGSYNKHDWSGWEKYGKMAGDCPFCQLSRKIGCPQCPYKNKFGSCCDIKSPYWNWHNSKSKITRKKYAKLFLEQLETL